MLTKRILYWIVVVGPLVLLVSPLLWYVFMFYENAHGPGWRMQDTVRILIQNQKSGGRAVRKAISYGDKILPLLKEESDSFDIGTLNSRNAFWISDVLGAIQSPESETILMNLYSRPDLSAKLVGAIGLAQHGMLPEEIDENSFLVKTIRDSSAGEYASLAIIALGRSGNPKAVPFLLGVLRGSSANPHSAMYACQALARLRSQEAIGVLREYLQSPESEALPAAFRALISLGDKDAVPLAIARVTPDIEGYNAGFIVDELKTVTGKNFGYDRQAWLRWWKSVEGKWEVPKKFLNAD